MLGKLAQHGGSEWQREEVVWLTWRETEGQEGRRKGLRRAVQLDGAMSAAQWPRRAWRDGKLKPRKGEVSLAVEVGDEALFSPTLSHLPKLQ